MVCGRRATSRADRLRLLRSSCRGPLPERMRAEAVARGAYLAWLGHAVMYTAPYWWCVRCGAFSRCKLRDLARQCRGRPAHGTATARRARLGNGLDPVDGAPLVAPVVRVTVAQWHRLLADACAPRADASR